MKLKKGDRFVALVAESDGTAVRLEGHKFIYWLYKPQWGLCHKGDLVIFEVLDENWRDIKIVEEEVPGG